ncbi:MAG: glycosyltransferase family 4 protein [Candidatus Helarchaeota archaeon]
MNVLFITQEVAKDSSILGFVHGWILEFSNKVDNLFVLSGRVGQHDLPKNVKVFSLGKEVGTNQLFRFMKFYIILIKLLFTRHIDAIFAHMLPEYVIASSFISKIRKVPIFLWYAHGSVSFRLKLACRLSTKIITSSKKGFRINTKKRLIVGHGINFKRLSNFSGKNGTKSKKIRIISVGRISPIKNKEILIKAVEILVKKHSLTNIEVLFIGSAPRGASKYESKLKKMVSDLKLNDYFRFIGDVSHEEIPSYFQSCDLKVNTSLTGSMDKTVLEAIACEKPVLTCNEAFFEFLKDYSHILIFNKRNPQDLAQKIKDIIQLDETEKKKICRQLRKKVEEEHNLKNLVTKVINIFEDYR